MLNSCKRLISYLTYMIYIFFKLFLLQNKRKQFKYVASNFSPCCIIAVLYQLSLLLMLKETYIVLSLETKNFVTYERNVELQ